jgi:hypothetical protein
MNLDAKVNNEIFRKDHPIIIAMNRHLATIIPVRLAYDSDGYLAGLVLGKVTSTGEHQAYDDGNSPAGVGVALGVLMEDVPVESFPSATGSALARMVVGGELFKAKLTGLDANAITDLGARTITGADGVDVLKF